MRGGNGGGEGNPPPLEELKQVSCSSLVWLGWIGHYVSSLYFNADLLYCCALDF